MPNLPKRYNEFLEAEGYVLDAQQEMAVEALQCLLTGLSAKKSIWPFGKKEPLRGVYLYGGVGRGKSMLMELFLSELQAVSEKAKKDTAQNRRIHFHEFMIETHNWLHKNRGSGMGDLLLSYAKHVAENVKVLCFDEFHVTDVADAMILGRLFTALFERGVIVVSTSNWAPDNLYEGGLQRELFLPFIALLKEEMNVVHLDSDTDYRRIADPDQSVYYFYPLNVQTKKKVEAIFEELAGQKTTQIETLTVKGRDMEVAAANGIARFTFAQLCEQPLGAEDYIEVAKKYETIFIEAVPRLGYDRRNEAKRLILLIDCLYEAGCRLIISAQDDLSRLYSGKDHAFEFDRTISRLMEMQSAAYHEKRVSR